MTMTTKDWLQLILLGALWGAAYFFVEIALEGFAVLPLVTARIVLAAFALWLFNEPATEREIAAALLVIVATLVVSVSDKPMGRPPTG